MLVLQLHLLKSYLIQLLVDHTGGRLEHQVEHQPYMFEVPARCGVLTRYRLCNTEAAMPTADPASQRATQILVDMCGPRCRADVFVVLEVCGAPRPIPVGGLQALGTTGLSYKIFLNRGKLILNVGFVFVVFGCSHACRMHCSDTEA